MLGAALLPGAFGLMLAAVRPERTSAASAIAQIPINLLGMAGGENVWGLAVLCTMVLHLLKWAGAYIPGWLTGCNQEELPDVPFCDAGLPFDPALQVPSNIIMSVQSAGSGSFSFCSAQIGM